MPGPGLPPASRSSIGGIGEKLFDTEGVRILEEPQRTPQDHSAAAMTQGRH